MTAAAVAIFVLTYSLIASRRLRLLPIGRPAGALLGAVLMVGFGVLTPQASYRAVDGDTLVLLFGMMLLTAYLQDAGLFDWLAAAALRRLRSPFGLLIAVSLLAAFLSAVLVNDTVCLFLTPMVLGLCAAACLPPGPYLIALATSANIGSAATLVGNPQNMIIGSLSGISFADFLLGCGPAVLAALAVNLGLLWLYYGRRLRGTAAPRPPVPPSIGAPRRALVLAVGLGVLAGFFAGWHMGYTALGGAMVFVLAGRRDPRPIFARVDWALLVFFACLFIVVAGLVSTGLVAEGWGQAAPWIRLDSAGGQAAFSGLMLLGSNVVSNVPMTLLAGPFLADGALSPELARLGWLLLGFTTTLAGNLTLLGSVANIIVAERARDAYPLGYWEYLRFGAVSTLLGLAVGVPLIVLCA